MVQIPYKLWQSIYALIWGPLKWRISKRPSQFWLGYWFLHLPSLSCVNINRTHLFSKQSFQFRGVDVDWLHLSFDDPPLFHPSKPTTFSNMHININFNIMIWASILIIPHRFWWEWRSRSIIQNTHQHTHWHKQGCI